MWRVASGWHALPEEQLRLILTPLLTTNKGFKVGWHRFERSKSGHFWGKWGDEHT